MTEKQLQLIAKIVIGLCKIADIYAPYHAWGVNVGQCRYCGVIGEMRYPDIFYDHKPECLMPLAKQLYESLQGGEHA